MPKKDIKAKLESAAKKLAAVKAAPGDGADKKAKAKLRLAAKKVKRAQRKLKSEKVLATKVGVQGANKRKKTQTASDKAAKKAAAGDAALTAAADAQQS